MSSSSTPKHPEMPFYSRIFSIRTFFFLILSLGALIYTLLLLWTGLEIMNRLIEQYSTELLAEKLNSVIQRVDQRYANLQRLGLEDSLKHHAEIMETAREQLSLFSYKNTGTFFIIGKDGTIILSSDFSNEVRKDFDNFFSNLSTDTGSFTYTINNKDKFCIYRYYPPWDSFLGITIDEKERFLPRKVFVNIVLMLLGAVLLGAILFSSIIQRVIISPLIRISRFANQIGKGNFDEKLEGKYILELSALKIDVEQMVDTLRQKMDQTSAQLQLIGERERWLDEALRSLQESEKKYRAIYNAPSDAIVIFDPEKGKIVDANKGMFDMFGYHIDNFSEMDLADLSADESNYRAKKFASFISRTLAGETHLFEWLCRKKDGEIFWAEIALQATYLEGKKQILGVIRNIHTRKMAQEELASEKERLAVTLRSIGDGVITTDKRGRVRLMNKVAESLTGWRQHEAAGRMFSEVFNIVHLKTKQPCENPVDRILATGDIIELASDTLLIAKDGVERIIADSGAPIRDPDSAVIGSVIVFRDVTDEKRMEEELFKVKKLESVGVLAGGIAHDFNNILVGILGNISLARQCLGDRKKSEDLLLNTEKAAMRAKDLTAQLLTFSRGGEPVIQSTSIASTIIESAEFALRGSNVKLSFDIPQDLWLVNADTGQISQVIQNIVLNSRQAIPEEGMVEIACSNSSGNENAPESIRDKCVVIIIRDNGPGIPEDIIGKVFDPYFTTKDDGSGLGLAICHSIILKHKGTISVDAQSGSGTTFTIRLPVSPDQQTDPFLELPTHSFSKQKLKILVMDDDPMILELSQQMLQYLGHEVVLCDKGESALQEYEKAMNEEKPFNLVIMDLTIPGGMGGEKAIKKLLKIDSEARAIVSSGYSNDKVMSDYMYHGFKAVVVKPYQIEDLDKAIQKALKK